MADVRHDDHVASANDKHVSCRRCENEEPKTLPLPGLTSKSWLGDTFSLTASESFDLGGSLPGFSRRVATD
jgi:hypothetical protein